MHLQPYCAKSAVNPQSIYLFVPVTVLFSVIYVFVVFQSTYHSVITVLFASFQSWVSENVTNDFQDGFIVDVEPNQKEGYVVYMLWCDVISKL